MDSIERSRMVGRFRKLSERDKRIVSRLKRDETPAESALWELLRDCQIMGLKFRRQHKVGRYVLDFFCIKRLLAIEVDGSIHAYRAKEDAARTQWLETLGIRVIRFPNRDVFVRPGFVIKVIEETIISMNSNFPPSPPKERGERTGSV